MSLVQFHSQTSHRDQCRSTTQSPADQATMEASTAHVPASASPISNSVSSVTPTALTTVATSTSTPTPSTSTSTPPPSTSTSTPSPSPSTPVPTPSASVITFHTVKRPCSNVESSNLHNKRVKFCGSGFFRPWEQPADLETKHRPGKEKTNEKPQQITYTCRYFQLSTAGISVLEMPDEVNAIYQSTDYITMDKVVKIK